VFSSKSGKQEFVHNDGDGNGGGGGGSNNSEQAKSKVNKAKISPYSSSFVVLLLNSNGNMMVE